MQLILVIWQMEEEFTVQVVQMLHEDFGGGENPALTNNIDYVTMASTGSGATFGELLYRCWWCRSNIFSSQGEFFWKYFPGNTNYINFVTVPTLGDAQDFGDTTKNSAEWMLPMQWHTSSILH